MALFSMEQIEELRRRGWIDGTSALPGDTAKDSVAPSQVKVAEAGQRPQLPEGVTYVEEPKRPALPKGVTYVEETPKPPPQGAAAEPRSMPDVSELDPFERAAMRQTMGVISDRTPGRITAVAEKALPTAARAVGTAVQGLNESARRVIEAAGERDASVMDPSVIGDVASVATLANPVSPAYRTGRAVFQANLTPFERAQRETGVTSVPSAALSGTIAQGTGRAISGLPVGGGRIRSAAERASAELEAAGGAAAARPTGVVPTQNLAGSNVRSGLQSRVAEHVAAREAPPSWMTGMLRQSNEDMIGAITRMAAETRAGANVNRLAEMRRIVEPSRWSNVQGAVIDRLGQSNRTGQFDAATWVANYGNLSHRGKAILFGDPRSNLRVHLDAIETVAREAPRWQQFQRERAALGTRGGALALYRNPLAVLTGLLPVGLLTRGLSNPHLAAPIAQWSRAYEKIAKTSGAPNAIASFVQATRNLNNNLGTDIDPDAILRGEGNGQPVE